MKPILTLTLGLVLNFIFSNSKVYSQQIQWTYTHGFEVDNFGTCFPTNTIVDQNQNIIVPIVESDSLKLKKISPNGQILNSIYTGNIISRLSEIIKIAPDTYKLIYQTPNNILAIKFNNNLDILENSNLSTISLNKLSNKALLVENTLFFAGSQNNQSHTLVGINNQNNVVVNHNAATGLAHGEDIKLLSNNNILFDFKKDNGNTVQCINATNGNLVWQAANFSNDFEYTTATDNQQNVYYAGHETYWINGVKHDSLSLFKFNENGTITLSKKIEGGVELSNLVFNETNNKIYLTYGRATLNLIEFNTDFDIINKRTFLGNYQSDLNRVNPISNIFIKPDGRLIYTYKFYKNEIENGNIMFYHLQNDLTTIENLEFNISPKNSDEILTHIKAYNDSTFVLNGYTNHVNDAVIDEQIEGFTSMLTLKSFNQTSTQTPVIDKTNVKISPNPAQNIINVHVNKPINMLTIYNTYGKKIMEHKNSNSADITGLNAGVYIIKIELPNAEIVSSKFIKHP